MSRSKRPCQCDLHVFRLLAIVIMTGCTVAWAAGGQPAKPEADAAALARKTLAEKLLQPIEAITVVRVSPAEWRDTSLGCPERGVRYQPVLTAGYQVRLRDSEREHTVHVAGGRAVVCSSKADARLSSAPFVAASIKAGDAVRAALAKTLGIDPSQVRVVSTRPARSASSNCLSAPQAPNGTAYLVEAEADGRKFLYYADDAVTVSCQ
jgi:hypothetical protein